MKCTWKITSKTSRNFNLDVLDVSVLSFLKKDNLNLNDRLVALVTLEQIRSTVTRKQSLVLPMSK